MLLLVLCLIVLAAGAIALAAALVWFCYTWVLLAREEEEIKWGTLIVFVVVLVLLSWVYVSKHTDETRALFHRAPVTAEAAP